MAKVLSNPHIQSRLIRRQREQQFVEDCTSLNLRHAESEQAHDASGSLCLAALLDMS